MTPKIKKLLPLIIVLVLLISIPIGIYLVQRQTQIKSKAVNNSAKTVNLSANTTTPTVTVGNNISVDVRIDSSTGGIRNDFSGIDFVMVYPTQAHPSSYTGPTNTCDPATQGNGRVSLAQSGFVSSFGGTQIVNQVDDGNFHFAAFENNKTPTRGGVSEYKVGTLTFTAVSPGCVTIDFGNAIVTAASLDLGVTIDHKSSLNLTVTAVPSTVTNFIIPSPSGGTFIQGEDTQFQMNWNTSNSTACSLQTKDSSGDWNNVASTGEPGSRLTLPYADGPNTTGFRFTETPVLTAKQYDLRIQCANSAGVPAYSDPVTVTANPAAATVTGFNIQLPSGGSTFVQGEDTQFQMSWDTPNPTSACSLQLHNGSSFLDVVANEPGFEATIPSGVSGSKTTSFNFIAPMVSGRGTKGYRLRIQCANSLGVSAYSNPETVTANPPPPIPGDATGDRCVNDADRNCWDSNSPFADFNSNGVVDGNDYTQWLDASNSKLYVCASGQSSSECKKSR